jgi:hypothetical protein
MQRLGLTTISCLALTLALTGCTDDNGTAETAESETGDGDGDTGDGDGDSGDGDGDTGDGDGDTGDGDGDSGDGDGDGDTGDGDGDGDTGDGDGDGDTGDGDGDSGDGDGDTGDGDGDGDAVCLGAGIGDCQQPPVSDGFQVIGLTIVGDCLEVEVSYGGGCEIHAYDPCWNGSFAESFPVQATLWVDHDAMNDLCDAIVQDTWVIDLTSMKTAWQDAYQNQSGSIILHVGQDSIQYDF